MWHKKKRSYNDNLLSSLLKDVKEGASAVDAGSKFQTGMVLGKKENLNESVRVE